MLGVVSPFLHLALSLSADLGISVMVCRSGLMEKIMEPVHGRHFFRVLHCGFPLFQHARGGLQHCI